MILVTGATGNVGAEVVAQLLARGKSVRVFTRDANKVAQWGNRVEVATGDFQTPETFGRAVASAEAVFLMSQNPDQEAFRRLVSAAKAAGTPRIVFLSTLVADQPDLPIGLMHKIKEESILASGLPATFVRPGGFMSNAFQWIRTIQAEATVYNPLADTRFPPIASEDIAAVAVEALINASTKPDVFELTGGEMVSVPEQVRILSRVLGKPLQCVAISIETAVENLIRGGIPAPLAQAVGKSYQAVRNGLNISITNTVEQVTGRRPMTFEDWTRKYAARFLESAARPSGAAGR